MRDIINDFWILILVGLMLTVGIAFGITYSIRYIHHPDFYIKGKGYKTTTYCDSSITKMEFHYGIGFNGKGGYHWTPITHCITYKTDTIEVKNIWK